MGEHIEKIVNPIVKWYQKQDKNLPWKKDKEPYHIWVSEIMLQQTRIEAVKKYYERFIKKIPNIQELVIVSDEELLKLWEGLGYYSRARNLKKAAIQIEKEYHGEMPKTYEELIKLSGIGEYTAGAIASISYNESVPAVDGNVLRVISRILASRKNVLLPETKKEINSVLLGIIPKEAGDFNQGLMELGEKICLPNTAPKCDLCPVKKYCESYKKGLTNEIPVRIKKERKKVEIKTVFVLKCDNKIAIRKREEKGLLANLYEFPNVDQEVLEENIVEILENWNLQFKQLMTKTIHKHVFTHIEWKMVCYQIEVIKENLEFKWVEEKDLQDKYPLPTAFRKVYMTNKEA